MTKKKKKAKKSETVYSINLGATDIPDIDQYMGDRKIEKLQSEIEALKKAIVLICEG